MADYYVNKNKDNKGDHEVHATECHRMPYPQNRSYLGDFPNCRPAVKEAKKQHSTANGCKHCSKECHTS
ncbi:MAG: hypothetical protein GY730_06530 [bacterium]|nr:hypothetical protein [bacterium]